MAAPIGGPCAFFHIAKAVKFLRQLNYILKRTLQIIPVLLIVTIITFLMIHLIPGDPARILAGEKARQATVEAMRIKLGLDKPLYVQYWIYLKDLVTLDLGTSLQYSRPVIDIILERLPLTIKLTLFSTLLGLLFAIPLGYLAGIKKDKGADHVIRLSTLVAIAMPSFWVGLLLMIVFSINLKWLPAGGWDPTSAWTQFKCLLMPAFTQSLMTAAILIRNMRNSVVDITRQDYVDFARSKGISARAVRTRHIFRNSMVSTVTLLSMRMAALLGGSVIIETVFSLPGIGKLTYEAISSRDYTTVQSVVFLFALLVLVINLLTDIVYSFLDPRVKL